MSDETKREIAKETPLQFAKDTHSNLVNFLGSTEGVCFGITLTLGTAYLTGGQLAFNTALQRLADTVGSENDRELKRMPEVLKSMAGNTAASARLRVFKNLRTDPQMQDAQMCLRIKAHYPHGVEVSTADKDALEQFNTALQKRCMQLNDSDYQKPYDELLAALKEAALKDLSAVDNPRKKKLCTHCVIETHVSFSEKSDVKERKLSLDETYESTQTKAARARFQEAVYREMTQNMADADKRLADLPAMSDSILLLQEPNSHKAILVPEDKSHTTTYIPQKDNRTLPLVQSLESEAQQNSVVAISPLAIGCYQKEELIVYLQKLLDIFNAHKITEPVMLLLGSVNHFTTVIYDPQLSNDPNKRLCFTNIGALQLAKNDKMHDPAAIANAITAGFFNKTKGINIFSTQVYSKSKHQDAVKKAWDAFFSDPDIQALHQITPEKAGAIDAEGANLLYIAVKEGDINAAKVALDHKHTNLNQITAEGATSLMLAAQNEDISNVEALLDDERTDPNLTTTGGKTPLYVAAQYGHTKIVEKLLNDKFKRIDPNLAKTGGVTPLYAAAYFRKVETVKVLLRDERVDPTPVTTDGTTPLYIAAYLGHVDVVRALLDDERTDPNQAKTDGTTPLQIATSNGHLEVMRVLLAGGAKPDPSWKSKSKACTALLQGCESYKKVLKTKLDNYMAAPRAIPLRDIVETLLKFQPPSTTLDSAIKGRFIADALLSILLPKPSKFASLLSNTSFGRKPATENQQNQTKIWALVEEIVIQTSQPNALENAVTLRDVLFKQLNKGLNNKPGTSFVRWLKEPDFDKYANKYGTKGENPTPVILSMPSVKSAYGAS